MQVIDFWCLTEGMTMHKKVHLFPEIVAALDAVWLCFLLLLLLLLGQRPTRMRCGKHCLFGNLLAPKRKEASPHSQARDRRAFLHAGSYLPELSAQTGICLEAAAAWETNRRCQTRTRCQWHHPSGCHATGSARASCEVQQEVL